MNSELLLPASNRNGGTSPFDLTLGLGFVALTTIAAFISAALPVTLACATVFLFAGPHNWLEMRYALGRMPARSGKLRPFLIVSVLGIMGLGGSYAVLSFRTDSSCDYRFVVGLFLGWNVAFLFWMAVLIVLRSRTNPRFDGGWVLPGFFIASAIVFYVPIALPITLIYLHPLMSLWLLDLEFRRSRPHGRGTLRLAMIVVPISLIFLWWQFHDTNEWPDSDARTFAFALTTVDPRDVANRVGAFALPGLSPVFLVSAHTFLELIHYGVWVALMPVVGIGSRPLRVSSIPVARRGRSWARSISLLLVGSLFLVFVLWVCFVLDFEKTRRIYFGVAMIHVLAEFPLALRLMTRARSERNLIGE